MTDLSIKPLTKKLIPDYLELFDHMEFTEHPDWASCYCYSFHFVGPAKEWMKESNRSAVIRLIGEGTLRGYLAFSGAKPVGWCNINDRNLYPRLWKYYDPVDRPGKKVASVVCFLVRPEFRGKGIARQLLERACSDYAASGYDILEAYPVRGKHRCEGHYVGPLSMYLNAGFEQEHQRDKFVVVKKILR